MSEMSQIELKEMRAKKRANRMLKLKEKIKQDKAVLACKKRKVKRKKKAASERRRMARVRSEQVAERKAVKEQAAYEMSEREYISENVELFPFYQECVEKFVIGERVTSLIFPVVFTLDGIHDNERFIYSFTEKQYMTMRCYWYRLAEFEKRKALINAQKQDSLLFPVANDKFEEWAEQAYESAQEVNKGRDSVCALTVSVNYWGVLYKIKCDFFGVTR